MAIILHGAGGAGINVVGNLVEALNKLGAGFAKFKPSFIDTTERNIEAFGDKFLDDFYRIVPKEHSKEEIDGSGAERRSNAQDIVNNVKDYLDEKGFHKPVTGEFHIVVSSASGGTGSVANPIIVKDLASRNIPVIPILIGDNSNYLMTHNTINTIATFVSIAKSIKKPINMGYINNSTMNGKDILEQQEKADKLIFAMLMNIALFTSGTNTDIDYQDMVGLFNPSVYKSFKVPAGLYAVTTMMGKMELPVNTKPVLSRTLIAPGTDHLEDLGNFIHTKVGYIGEENALEKVKEKLPIHVATFAGYFQAEERLLKQKLQEEQDRLDSLRSDNFAMTDDADVDESGLVF